MNETQNIEKVWEALLSEEPPRIRHAWLELTDEEAVAVLEHLKRMASGEEWAEAQRHAAATALAVIRGLSE
jgi:hypothetical protein